MSRDRGKEDDSQDETEDHDALGLVCFVRFDLRLGADALRRFAARIFAAARQPGVRRIGLIRRGHCFSRLRNNANRSLE